MEWLAVDTDFFVALFAGIMAFDIAKLNQFFFELNQIIFGYGDIKGSADGIQMFQLIFCFLNLDGEGFPCTFQFSIAVKVFDRVFVGT